MRRKDKETDDLESVEQGSMNSEEPQSKSFMVGGGQRIVTLTFPQVQLKKPQSYRKQAYCVICLRNFSRFFRQHHCRVCANAVCGDCSRSYINKERACDLCIMQFTNPHEQKKQKEILGTLQTLCAYLIYRRNLKMTELETLKSSQGEDSQAILQEIQQQDIQIQALKTDNDRLKEEKELLEGELEKIREANAQIQESIAQIQREIGTDRLDEYV